MRKLIVIGMVLAIMSLGVAASAAIDATWVVQLRASNSAGASAGTITLATKVGAVDAFLPPTEDATMAVPTSGYGVVVSNIVALCNKDYRAPLTTAQTIVTPKVWELSLYIQGGAAGNITLKGWTATLANMIDGPDTIVELWKGAEKVWTYAPGVSGTSIAPLHTNTWALGASETLILELRAYTPVIPEPGSIIALLTGLVGLVGLRRRK